MLLDSTSPNSVIYVLGDTFSFGGTITGLPAGDWEAASQLRTRASALLAEFTVTMGPPDVPGGAWSILLEMNPAEVDQSAWPLGPALCDLRIFESTTGVVYHTATFEIVIQAAVTQPPPL